MLRRILTQCVEYQKTDGQKELKPKSGKKLLLTLRNVDVGKSDEYNHSELFTLLWGLIAHQKVSIRG